MAQPMGAANGLRGVPIHIPCEVGRFGGLWARVTHASCESGRFPNRLLLLNQHHVIGGVAGDVGVVAGAEATDLVVTDQEALRGLAAVALPIAGGGGREEGAIEVNADGEGLPRDCFEGLALKATREVQELLVRHSPRNSRTRF